MGFFSSVEVNVFVKIKNITLRFYSGKNIFSSSPAT